MKDLNELFQLIQRTLSQQGFKLTNLLRNDLSNCWFVLGNELERRQVSNIANYEAFYGLCIEVKKCYRGNGSKEDVSYYVAIETVDRGAFKDYKKIKLQKYQMEPTLVRKITDLVTEYKQMVEEQKLEKLLDELM